MAALLKAQGVQLYSTGGTFDYLKQIDPNVKTVESLTGYPSILGGRVKTLHPKVFGGILGRTQLESDQQEMAQYEIPAFDLVIVDLYPFEETVASTEEEQAIIEKIDDSKTKLDLEDDAARANWGGTWRMPTNEELEWLRQNCTWKWTDNYGGIGAIGVTVTSIVPGYEGNRLFFPAAGFQTNSATIDVGSKGNYWSSCLKPVSIEVKTEQAYNLHFYGCEVTASTRFSGLSVRPVSD